MSARLVLNGKSLADVEKWLDRAKQLGVDPHADVVFTDRQGRLAVPVAVKRTILAQAETTPTADPMRHARRRRS